MPRTGDSGYTGGSYDTATNTFRPSGPLPLPLKKLRKPRPSFAGPTQPAKPYVPIPRVPSKGNPGNAVKFPQGVSNGKY